MTLENLLVQIEASVKKLESGDLTLDQSLAAYEQGVALVREAQKNIEQLDGKVEELLSDGTKKAHA